MMVQQKQLIAFSVAMLFFCISSAAVATVHPRYLRSFFADECFVGLIASVAYMVEILLCFPVGRLSDTIGRKRMLVISFVSTSLIFFAFYVNEMAIALIPLQTGLVLFALPLWITGEAFVKDISPVDRRGEFRSIFGTFSNAGFFAGVIIAGTLEMYFGLRSPYLFATFLTLASLPIVFCLEETVNEEDRERRVRKTEDKNASDQKELGFLFFCTFSLYFWYAAKWVFGPLFLENLGYRHFHIALWFAVSLIPFIIIQIPLGKVSDRVGKTSFVGIGMFISAVSTIPLSFSESYEILILFVLLASIGNTISEPLMEARVADIVPRSRYGSFSGIFEIAKIGGLIAGSALSAVFISISDKVFIPSSTILLLSALSFFFVHGFLHRH